MANLFHGHRNFVWSQITNTPIILLVLTVIITNMIDLVYSAVARAVARVR